MREAHKLRVHLNYNCRLHACLFQCMLTFSSTKNDAIVCLIWMKHLSPWFCQFLVMSTGIFLKLLLGDPQGKTFDLKLSRQWLYPEFVSNVAAVPQSGHQFLFPQQLRGKEDDHHVSPLPLLPPVSILKGALNPQFHTLTGRYIVLSSLPLGCPSDTYSFWDWKCPVCQTNHCHLHQGNFYSLV